MAVEPASVSGVWVIEMAVRLGRMMALLCAGALLPQPALSQPRGAVPLITLVQHAIGGLPADCGYFSRAVGVIGDEPRPETVQRAVDCVATHARARRRAWFRIRGGMDSEVAAGLMTGADGRVRKFTYDSDPSGGSGAGSRFDDTPCERPQLLGGDISCSPLQ